MPSLILSSSGLPSLGMDEISGSQLAQRLCPVRMATRHTQHKFSIACMHKMFNFRIFGDFTTVVEAGW